jgi:hypothetical protein
MDKGYPLLDWILKLQKDEDHNILENLFKKKRGTFVVENANRIFKKSFS